jgi:hypothetical protein
MGIKSKTHKEKAQRKHRTRDDSASWYRKQNAGTRRGHGSRY